MTVHSTSQYAQSSRSPADGESTRIALVYAGQHVPFVREMLLAAFNAAARLGAQIVLRACSSTTKTALKKLTHGLTRSGIHGVLLAPPCAEVLVGSAVLADMTVAAITTAGALPGIHTLRIDNRTATATLTEHLIRLGHRRIGFIAGPPRHGDSVERRAGYTQAMEQAGLPVPRQLIAEGAYTFESGRVGAELLLDLAERPTAIVASNDEMAAGALWTAQQRGLSLPDDLSVVGFDDTPRALETWPPLTVIRQPIGMMVERAMALLIDAARNAKTSAPSDVILDHALVERASTARCKAFA